MMGKITTTAPGIVSEQDKGKQKMNGLKTAIAYQDVVNQMSPNLVESVPPGAVDYLALLAGARVRPTDKIDEEPVCLAIEKDGIDYVIGTMGNLSTITGRAKAKKTFAVSFAVAAAVASVLILNRIKGTLPSDKPTVLLFDTEQSRPHVLRVIKRICRLCNIPDPQNLIVYSLRPFAPNDRLKAIDFAINNTPNVGLVVVDGVRDLAVDPVLDSEQASHIMTHLLQWTDRLNIHIICVLHQNKSDTNVRGHLGTELVNKSETVISVTRDSRDKEVSHVEAEYCRNREFDPFSFSIDVNGLPYLVDEGETNNNERTVNTRRGRYNVKKVDLPTVDTMKPETVKAIVERAFSQESQLAYGQLKTNIIEASQHNGATLSDARARPFIQRIVLSGMLTKFLPEKARWDHYKINPESFEK